MWAYHGTLQNTTVHCNGPRQFSTNVYSWDLSSKVCCNPPQDDITQTEGLHLRQNKICGYQSQRPWQNQCKWHKLYGLRWPCVSTPHRRSEKTMFMRWNYPWITNNGEKGLLYVNCGCLTCNRASLERHLLPCWNADITPSGRKRFIIRR